MRGPAARRVIAFALLVLACWATLVAIASPVRSEVPVLRATSPGAGSIARPDNLVLTFDRPVDAGLATVRMTDPYHRPVEPGRPAHAGGRADTVSVPIPKQKYAGTYSVSWSVPAGTTASASGAFTFDLASRSPAQDAPALSTRPGLGLTIAYGVAQFGALAAFAVLAGAALVAAAGGRSFRKLATYGWFGAIVFTLASFVLFGPYTAKLPLTDALQGGLLSGTVESGAGGVFFARLAVLALGGLALAQLMTSEPAPTARERWMRVGTVFGCASAVAATWGFLGPGAAEPLSLAVDVVHVTAIAALCGVLVAGWPRPAPGLALAGVGVVALSGGYLFWRHGFDRPPQLLTWVGELALVLVLVAMTFPRRRWAAFARAGAGVLLVAATAMLAVTGMATDRAQSAPVRLPFDTGDDRGLLDLAVAPGKTGANQVYVSVLDAKDVAKDGFGVSVALSPPGAATPPVPVPLTRAGTGYSAGSVSISGPGQWELALTIQSAGGKQETIYGVVDVPA